MSRRIKPGRLHNWLVAELRRRQGKRTQKELAQELGISQQFLGDILRGQRSPGEELLAKLGLVKEVIYRKRNDDAA